MVAVPVILHLLSRRTARVLEWGAMLFLLESVESRKRRVNLEEALLLATRCALAAVLALAVARPFVPPGASTPWGLVLPAFFLGLIAFTTAMVLRGSNRKAFRALMAAAVFLILTGAAAVALEKYWNLKRFGFTGGRDIAIVIDASTSMQLPPQSAPEDGAAPASAPAAEPPATVFQAAVAEAREIVENAPSGSAFSLILGGPSPSLIIPEPIVNRSEVLAALDGLRPATGKMAAFDALAAAAVTLARGTNPRRDIIVLTDGQSVGWETENRGRWDALTRGFSVLPSPPEVILRRFPLPPRFRNVAVTDVKYSRDVIGVDRPVFIEVTLENTGEEAVTPEAVELKIGGLPPLKAPGPGQMRPGVKQTVRFTHQFAKPGAVAVRASVAAEDDLPLDNARDSVVRVEDRLGVLIIEGNPDAPLMERAAAFTALALAPVSAAAAKESENRAVTLDPEVLPLTRVGSLESLAKYSVVVLADVPRLPESAARRLASWVQSGGGLLLTPGSRALPEFYNTWRDAGGALFVPAALSRAVIPPEPVKPALSSFSHAALTTVADEEQSDLGSALLGRFWRLDTAGREGAFVAARLENGDPFLAGRRSGFGAVFQTCVNFDTAGGSLPSRQAFVPLAHQLVYYLANPDGQPLNRAPSARVDLPLGAAMTGGGLKGEYFRGKGSRTPVMVRIDAKPDFEWNRSPGPGLTEKFHARWTGALIPRYSEEYTFDGWGDDQLAVWIGGKRVLARGGDGKVRLEAGKFYPIRIELTNTDGGAGMELWWSSPSQRREIVPQDCLTPFPPPAPDAPESPGGTLEVLGPDGRTRRATRVFTAGGPVLRLDGGAPPGLHRALVPENRREEFARLLSPPEDGGGIPFAIVDDASESRLTPLSGNELAFLRERLRLVEPENGRRIQDILAGREFGEELWKYLAFAALVLLVAEIALTRWIAVSRAAA